MHNISQTSLLAVEIPVPDALSDQDALVAALTAAATQRRALEVAATDSHSRIASLRRSLLHAAFTGQLTKEFPNE